MQNDLLKFRGLNSYGHDNTMLSADLLYIVTAFQKDIDDKSVDPYLYKYAVPPPQK